MIKLTTLLSLFIFVFSTVSIANDNNQSVVKMVHSEAQKLGIDPTFAKAIAMLESGFKCKVVSGDGAYGVMQIKYATAREVGYKGSRTGLKDCNTSIKYGMLYLKKALVKAGGNICVASNYYNRGLYSKPKHDSDYCRKVRSNMKKVASN